MILAGISLETILSKKVGAWGLTASESRDAKNSEHEEVLMAEKKEKREIGENASGEDRTRISGSGNSGSRDFVVRSFGHFAS